MADITHMATVASAILAQVSQPVLGTAALDITDGATILIAILALIVSVWTVISTQRHNRLSVRPRLAIHRYFDQDDWSGLSVANLGLGPAIVESFEFMVDGQAMPDWNHALTRLGFDDESRDLTTRSFRANDTIANGDSGFLIRLDGKAKDYAARRENLQTALKRLRVRAKYKSMYDERHSLEW